MNLIVINKQTELQKQEEGQKVPAKKKTKRKKKNKGPRGKQGGQLPGFEKASNYLTGGQTMKRISSSIESNRSKH